MIFLPNKCYMYIVSYHYRTSALQICCFTLQKKKTNLLFFTYVLSPKLSEIDILELSSHTDARISEVRTAQWPLLASVHIRFQ
jgi:hypothetical protein